MSFGAAVLTFREGLEAALIVAIMLGYLRKVGRMDYQWSVWGGALSAGLMAMLFTVGLQVMGAQFEYPAKGIYEGLTSLLAVGMLTYMIFWMSRQARYIKGSLEHSMKLSLAHGAAWGLFGLAFVTVIREGVETALFLSASAFQTSGFATLVGSIVGAGGGHGAGMGHICGRRAYTASYLLQGHGSTAGHLRGGHTALCHPRVRRGGLAAPGNRARVGHRAVDPRRQCAGGLTASAGGLHLQTFAVTNYRIFWLPAGGGLSAVEAPP